MEKYLIDDERVNEEEFYERLEEEVRESVEDNYDDMLDELYEPYSIGVCTFYASQVLKELDPIAYNCGIDDFVDSQLSDAKYDLECGRDFTVNSYTFQIVEDDEDEEDEEDED